MMLDILKRTDIQQVKDLHEAYKKAGLDISDFMQFYTAKQENQKEAVEAKAGNPGVITFATALAGRGTDINLTELAKNKGLSVIALCLHTSKRVEEQLRGRAGRQGKAGETKIYILTENGSLERKYMDMSLAHLGLRERNIIKNALSLFDKFDAGEVLTEKEEDYLNNAFDVAQKGLERSFVKTIRNNVKLSDMKFSLMNQIRAVQYELSDRIQKEAHTIAVPDIITEEVNKAVMSNYATSYSIIQAAEKLGVPMRVESLDMIISSEVYCNGATLATDKEQFAKGLADS